jgi:diguanylate cyclase (GGDEF)-like protein/putative nucleotidyltransferase with HDIG domain
LLSGLSLIVGDTVLWTDDLTGRSDHTPDSLGASTEAVVSAVDAEGQLRLSQTSRSLARWGWVLILGGIAAVCVRLALVAKRLCHDVALLRKNVARLHSRTADVDLHAFAFEELRECASDLAGIGAQIQSEQGRLTKHALRDPLTGLFNRRAMADRLSQEVAIAKRTGWPVSVIMADLDHFKVLNDKYGHQAGDVVLQHAAQRMASLVRKSDTMARFGGEEFAVILPNATLWQAEETAQQLCDALRSDSLLVDQQTLRITASFGVAEFRACGLADPDDLIEQADLALYEAKEAGRDTVVTAPAAQDAPNVAGDDAAIDGGVDKTSALAADVDTSPMMDPNTVTLIGSTFSMLRLIPDQHRVAHDMIQQVAAILGCRDLALFVRDESQDRLVRVAAVGACLDEATTADAAARSAAAWYAAVRSSGRRFEARSVALHVDPDAGEAGQSTVRMPLVAEDELVGVLEVYDAPAEPQFTERHHSLLSAVSLIGTTALTTCDLYACQESRWVGLIDVLCNVMQRENSYKRDHAARASRLALQIAATLGQSDADALSTLRLAALLHDVGEVEIPRRIRDKKGKLRASERGQIREHSSMGAEAIDSVPSMDQVAKIIRHHHEHHDGSGYPDGLAGDEIPWESRVIAVASAYVAMTSDRPYRPRMPEALALSNVLAGAGTQFDPVVVDAFMTCMEHESAQAQERERLAVAQ